MRVALTVAVLMLACCSLRRFDVKPPAAPTKFGCSILLIHEPDEKTRRYHVRVWADMPGRARWSYLYAVTAEDERKLALRFCHQWMAARERTR